MASTDARPLPLKNTAFRAVFPILDADGDLQTGATGLDSEVSKDQGTFADCTNEATEIATSSGMYYLDLTSTEMNADCVAVIVKTSSAGAKTTVLVFYPKENGDIEVDVRGNVKKGTAFAKFSFLMTDSTNHNPATGKTVSVTISKDGGAFGALSSGDTVTEIGNGIYEVDLNATDTNANVIILRATATGCDDAFERIITSI